MVDKSWSYFLSLERDLVRTANYVDISPNNSGTFSNEYAKLLLLIGSEVDAQAKFLCRDIDEQSSASNILQYQAQLTDFFPGMPEIQIHISRYDMSIQPWSSWINPDNSPGWWRSYNNVKHDRLNKFHEANQENVVTALCGLLAINLYTYRDVKHLSPYPEILEYNFPRYIVTSSNRDLPGYSRG